MEERMTTWLSKSIACAGLAAALIPAPALAQGGPPPEVRAAIQSVERMLEGTDDASVRTFAAERLAPAYRTAFTPETLEAHLEGLRSAVGGPTGCTSRSWVEERSRCS
jgi:hypothetical protein